VNDPVSASMVTRTHSQQGVRTMPGKADRFVNSKKAKGLLVGSHAVALLKPDWAKENGIRCGKLKDGTLVYSVLDIVKYVERVAQERQDSALENDAVRMWRTVVDQASDDNNTVAEAWANTHLLTAIAASATDILDVGAVTLE